MIVVRKSLTKQNIYEIISSYDIFMFYCTNFKEVNKHFISELRNDTIPSCSIIKYKGDLLYTDFGAVGEKRSLRAIDYVMVKYNISFIDALRKINEDFNLNLGYNTENKSSNLNKVNKILSLPKKEIKESTTTIINIKKRNFTDRDIKYWTSYGWTTENLLNSDITPISHYWITNNLFNNEMFCVGNALVYSYEYYVSNGIFRRKIYFPNRKKRKFISNIDNTVVQGKSMLPDCGDILFITSSYKDIGPLLTVGYNAIAPNAEGTFIPEKFLNKLKQRWKKIIIYFDNDETGITSAKKFSELYNIKYIHNNIGDAKDPSDYVFEHGINNFSNYLKSKICQDF